MGSCELSRTEPGRMSSPVEDSADDDGLFEAARRRATGQFDIDPWGFDEEFAVVAAKLSSLRWKVDVIGGARVPTDGPALLVVNRRFGVSEPAVVAQAVQQVSGRAARATGIPDLPMVASALRRVGGVLGDPAEVEGLLRAGEIVIEPLGWQPLHSDLAGSISSELVQPAINSGAPVLPVATFGSELGRRWRVMIGEPVLPPKRANKTGTVEFASAVRAAVQVLLDHPR